MKNIIYFLIKFFILSLIIFFGGSFFVKADSTSYDNLNNGGGISSGGDYILDSSIGQLDSGTSSGGAYQLSSGYNQGFTNGTFINIDVNPSGGVSMGGASGLMSGQISDGSADIKVTTDYAGYFLAVKASTDPAFKCNTSSGCAASDAFNNYSPVGGVGSPDYAWSIASTDSEFGYTVKGDDILAKFKYDTPGTSCGSGSSAIANYCWDALSTSDVNISSASSPNSPDGTTTKIKFRSQIGSNKLQPSGSYEASVTITAMANL